MTAAVGSGKERWVAAFAEAQAKGQVRDADFTPFLVRKPSAHGPDDEAADQRMERIGWPDFPLRGLYRALSRPSVDHSTVRRIRQRPAD